VLFSGPLQIAVRKGRCAMEVTHRYDLASDNTAGMSPAAWAALEQANRDTDASYGSDRWTQRVCDQVREIFETDCEVFFVFNGTAANSLALAQLCRPFHSVVCHEHSHIQTDECGAPEFFSGGSKLLPIAARTASSIWPPWKRRSQSSGTCIRQSRE
jgi:threonine aldolase